MTVHTQTTADSPDNFPERLAQLATTIQGQVIRPQETNNKKAPRVIVRCQNTADVIAVVNFARYNGLPVIAPGNRAPATANTGVTGIVIDLSPMNLVKVNASMRAVRVLAGARVADVDRATQPYGLATPTGHISTTSIAGCSGGVSWLRRKYGTALDNLLAIDMVTAGGRLRHIGEKEAAGLWASQCSSGSQDIVTALAFRLHPVGPEVTFLAAIYPQPIARKVLATWRDWTLTAPKEASVDCFFWTIPVSSSFPTLLHHIPVVVVMGMYVGPVNEGLQLFQPLRTLAKPLIDLTGPMPYLAAQSMFDPFFPYGLRPDGHPLYLEMIDDKALEIVLKQAAQRPSSQTLIAIRHIGGAARHLPGNCVAPANRAIQYLFTVNHITQQQENRFNVSK